MFYNKKAEVNIFLGKLNIFHIKSICLDCMVAESKIMLLVTELKGLQWIKPFNISRLSKFYIFESNLHLFIKGWVKNNDTYDFSCKLYSRNTFKDFVRMKKAYLESFLVLVKILIKKYSVYGL